MIPLHAFIAQSILDNPRRFSADEFMGEVRRRKNNRAAAASAISRLENKNLIEKVGEKSCGYAHGRKLNIYQILPGKEDELRELIKGARKVVDKMSSTKTKQAEASKPVIPAMAAQENSWGGLIGRPA